MRKIALCLGITAIVVSLSACSEKEDGEQVVQQEVTLTEAPQKTEAAAIPEETSKAAPSEQPLKTQETGVSDEPDKTTEAAATDETSETSKTGETDISDEIPETEDVYRVGDVSVFIPKSWKGHYHADTGKIDGIEYAAFYEKECLEQADMGWLFSVMKYSNDLYAEQPSYDIIKKIGNDTYVMVYPSDVQCEGVSKTAQRRYAKMAEKIESIREKCRE